MARLTEPFTLLIAQLAYEEKEGQNWRTASSGLGDDVVMAEVAKWANFYVIVGSTAGALIGLRLVVLTLIAESPPVGAAAAGAAFGSPTIVHFGATLFLSVLLNAPWTTVLVPASMWALLGFGGVVYSVIVANRMRKQIVYIPRFEDWSFHVALP